MIRRALVLSDIHLGWAVCTPSHRRWLTHLAEAAGDAELIVLNGDIVDAHRGVPRAEERELVEQLAARCASWRREGREVVLVEGNHDPVEHPLGTPVWRHDFEGAHGERILVLHGHRLAEAPFVAAPYEALGRHALAVENRCYASAAWLRALYPYGPGWIVGAWGLAEDRVWRPGFRARVASLLDRERVDTLVHGHYHFGPARTVIAGRLANVPAWRSGAWVASGHLGTVDRMLRYRDGTWERIGIVGERIRAIDDGR